MSRYTWIHIEQIRSIYLRRCERLSHKPSLTGFITEVRYVLSSITEHNNPKSNYITFTHLQGKKTLHANPNTIPRKPKPIDYSSHKGYCSHGN